MTKDDHQPVFRPSADSRLTAELQRMRALATPPADPSSVGDYRLHDGPCFLKLCPPTLFDPTSLDLIRGMYFPLDLWDAFMQDESSFGPRGGKVVTFEKPGRYLTNTLFTDLVRGGWIGSRDISTSALTALIRAGLDANKSLLLARAD